MTESTNPDAGILQSRRQRQAAAEPAVPLATEEEVKAREAEQAAEWGTWVAVANIMHGGVPAYTPGDPVPVSNVERYGYDRDNLVARQDSDEAQTLIRQIHEQGTESAVVAPLPPQSLAVRAKEVADQ